MIDIQVQENPGEDKHKDPRTQVQAYICGEGHNGQRSTECIAAVVRTFFHIHNEHLYPDNRDGYLRIHGADKMRMGLIRVNLTFTSL